MSSRQDDRSAAARRFVQLLREAVPREFDGPATNIQFGLRLLRRHGDYLLVYYDKYGCITNFVRQPYGLPPESSEVIEAAKSILQRDEFRSHRSSLASLLALGLPTAQETVTVAGRAEQSAVAKKPIVDDPIAAIGPVGSIGVRAQGGSASGRGAVGLGQSGPSGWSQSIARECERSAYLFLASRFGGKRCKWERFPEGPARLKFPDGYRIFEWLNAEGERGQSWDLEERDEMTGQILRRHEVKAPTAELTPNEHALAIQHGDAYVIWRIDPARRTMQRVVPRVDAGAPVSQALEPAEPAGPVEPIPSSPQTSPRWTPVVLRRSTRAYVTELAATNPIAVGRYRGNTVIAVVTTPALESRLPPSPNRRWIANRSMAGCGRLGAALEASGSAAVKFEGRGLLLVGVTMTGSVGLGRAVADDGRSFSL